MNDDRRYYTGSDGVRYRRPYCCLCEGVEPDVSLLTFASKNKTLNMKVRYCFACWSNKDHVEAKAFLKVMKMVDE